MALVQFNCHTFLSNFLPALLRTRSKDILQKSVKSEFALPAPYLQ